MRVCNSEHICQLVIVGLLQGVTSLPDYIEFKKFPGIPLNDIFSAAGDDLLDLLGSLLDCNPVGRVNATQVCINSQGSYSSLKVLEFDNTTSATTTTTINTTISTKTTRTITATATKEQEQQE